MIRTAFALLLLATPLAAADLPRVVAVSGPLADFASILAGDNAEVVYPVPEGEDPMLWRPGIKDISAIQSADLILLNGAGFAGWTAKASLPRARTLVTSADIEDRFIDAAAAVTHEHGGEGAHSHSGSVPQVWLDFTLAAAQVSAIETRLTRLLPGAKADVAARSGSLRDELSALDARARTLAPAFASRSFTAAGPGLAYFARAYGIDLSELDWAAGSEGAGRVPGDAAPGAVFLWPFQPDEGAVSAIEAAGYISIVFDTRADDPEGFVEAMSATLDQLEAAVTGG